MSLGQYGAMRDTRLQDQKQRAKDRKKLETHSDYKEYRYFIKERNKMADKLIFDKPPFLEAKRIEIVIDNLNQKLEEMKKRMLK